MLRTLRIENLVLIREAELTFGPGLNAVTGETGAGKTIFAGRSASCWGHAPTRAPLDRLREATVRRDRQCFAS